MKREERISAITKALRDFQPGDKVRITANLSLSFGDGWEKHGSRIKSLVGRTVTLKDKWESLSRWNVHELGYWFHEDSLDYVYPIQKSKNSSKQIKR